MVFITFPPYARAKITWSILDFKPELLQNNNFYSIESPEFSIRLKTWSSASLTRWKLSVFRQKSCISLYLKNVSGVDYASYKHYERLNIGYEIGILSVSGKTICHKTKGSFARIWYSERMGRLINYKELTAASRQYDKNRQLIDESNKLTIVVRLDLFENNTSSKPEASPMSEQYEKLFNNVKFSDFTLVTRDNAEIPVHKNILSIRSPVFETMMETSMRESQSGKATIDDIGSHALMEFLRFVYCGRVENIDEVAVELLYAATKYDIAGLKPLCVHSLMRNICVSNVIEVFMMADLHEEVELRLYCIDFIKWNYSELKEVEAWQDVPQRLYKTILDTVIGAENEQNSIINIASKIITASTLNATAPQ